MSEGTRAITEHLVSGEVNPLEVCEVLTDRDRPDIQRFSIKGKIGGKQCSHVITFENGPATDPERSGSMESALVAVLLNRLLSRQLEMKDPEQIPLGQALSGLYAALYWLRDITIREVALAAAEKALAGKE